MASHHHRHPVDLFTDLHVQYMSAHEHKVDRIGRVLSSGNAADYKFRKLKKAMSSTVSTLPWMVLSSGANTGYIDTENDQLMDDNMIALKRLMGGDLNVLLSGYRHTTPMEVVCAYNVYDDDGGIHRPSPLSNIIRAMIRHGASTSYGRNVGVNPMAMLVWKRDANGLEHFIPDVLRPVSSFNYVDMDNRMMSANAVEYAFTLGGLPNPLQGHAGEPQANVANVLDVMCRGIIQRELGATTLLDAIARFNDLKANLRDRIALVIKYCGREQIPEFKRLVVHEVRLRTHSTRFARTSNDVLDKYVLKCATDIL